MNDADRAELELRRLRESAKRARREDETRVTVTVGEAADIAQVSRRTIYDWMDKDRIEFIHTAGRGRRIYVDTLFRAGNAPVAVRTPRRRRSAG